MNVKYRSLPALPTSNNCTNLALLKTNCAMYFISTSAASIIETVLKISLSNTDVEDRKFEVVMTLLPLTLKYTLRQNIYFLNTFLFNIYKKVSNFSLTLKQALILIKIHSSFLINAPTSHEAVLQ